MPDIICLGEPLLEFNQQPDGNYLPGHGGDTSNCAIAAARQDTKVGYLTHIGNDSFGSSFMELWEIEGIDTSAVVKKRDAHTGIYFVTHGKKGHEFSYFRTGSAASLMGPEDVPVDFIAGARILHLSGISQAISNRAADAVFEAIEIAKKHNIRISYDTNLRLKLWSLSRARAVIHEAMSQIQIALPGLEDAEQLTGLSNHDQIVDFYLNLGAEIVALTLGPEGTLVATPDKRQLVQGKKVTSVDATAAGDTFDGAFLAELVKKNDPFKAAQYANAAAALSTQGYGAVAPIPKRKAVEAFMAKT